MLRLLLMTDDSPAQLFIRVALGVVMFPHGAQKAFGWFGGPGFFQTLQSFSEMGFPAWSTVLLMLTETVGAILLVFGLLTRIWALAFGTSITICMFISHIEYGFFMNWFNQQGGEGIEYHILVLGIVLALLLRGGGILSMDRNLSESSR